MEAYMKHNKYNLDIPSLTKEGFDDVLFFNEASTQHSD
jgi:hypothetical protein